MKRTAWHRWMRGLLAVGLGLAPLHAYAEPGIWTGIILASPLGGHDARVTLWLDAQARYSGTGYTYLARPGIGFDVSRHTAVHAGYAAVVRGHADSGATLEHRSWQQFMARGRAFNGVLNAQLRIRPEQRFRADVAGVGVRLRTMARFSVHPNPKSQGGIVLFNEAFVGFNETSWGAQKGYESNRLFAGFAIPHAHSGRTEIGFLDLATRGAGGWTHDPMISMTMFLAPPTRGQGGDR